MHALFHIKTVIIPRDRYICYATLIKQFNKQLFHEWSVVQRLLYSILIGSEVPDINYFLTLIKHYFFSQFYNYTVIFELLTIHEKVVC
jgi:hypothetical protein